MSARKLVALCCALWPGAAAPVAPAGAVVPGPPNLPLDAAEQVAGVADPAAIAPAPEVAMVSAVNRARAKRGRRPLGHSSSLNRSAHRYAAWMLRRDYYGHLLRIRAGGRYRRIGEALAMHFGWRSRIRRTVRSWLSSPTHRALLLSGRFRELGAGRATGRFGGRRATTWVLHLGG
ncbi:MAG TPA: CAP domain-containing protein [Thermoleophilaceae bacterium]|nr:CAP domain-containing protein [Thermoleophilaceae bacterium]